MGKAADKKAIFEIPDISSHQGTVNMKAVRNAGYRHIGIRAGYGKNNTDQKFADNAAACVNLGMKPLLYWFSYAYTAAMAKAEAGYAVDRAKKYWKRCPIAYDAEYDTRRYAATKGVDLNKKMLTDMAIAFLSAVKSAGYIPVIYTNRDYLQNYFDMDRITAKLETVYVWYARYGVVSLSASELAVADLWQYTATGSVKGISGNVDISRVYTDIWTDSVSVNEPGTTTEYGSYTVVRGDTLSGIGAKLKVPWKDIAAANGLKSPYTIYVGQTLKIPYTLNVPNGGQTSAGNVYIKGFQTAANRDGYLDAAGKKLNENGVDDVSTQFVRKQVSLQARKTKAHWIERSEGEVVKWLQRRLKEIMGIELSESGEYDAATVEAVTEFQKKYGLNADGIADYDTIQSMFYV